jgi:hypothetical protein
VEAATMVPVRAPRFGIEECNSEAERVFIEVLHDRADVGGWYADGWPREDRFILAVCPSDPDFPCVLRTLRVDFDGQAASFGPDETHQFATDLDPRRPGVTVLRGCPVTELATAAADWLEREMRRPIVRREWCRPGFWRREWVLADTGEPLGISDSANASRRPDLGEPDRVVHVSDGPAF